MSQFEKRRAKAEASLKSKKEPTLGQSLIKAADEAINYHTGSKVDETLLGNYVIGYDIFLNPDKRGYSVVTFEYNTTTRDMKLVDVKPIDRGIALSHEIRKSALKTLLKRSK